MTTPKDQPSKEELAEEFSTNWYMNTYSCDDYCAVGAKDGFIAGYEACESQLSALEEDLEAAKAFRDCDRKDFDIAYENLSAIANALNQENERLREEIKYLTLGANTINYWHTGPCPNGCTCDLAKRIRSDSKEANDEKQKETK